MGRGSGRVVALFDATTSGHWWVGWVEHLLTVVIVHGDWGVWQGRGWCVLVADSKTGSGYVVSVCVFLVHILVNGRLTVQAALRSTETSRYGQVQVHITVYSAGVLWMKKGHGLVTGCLIKRGKEGAYKLMNVLQKENLIFHPHAL